MAIFKCDICEQKDLRLLDKDKEIERLITQVSHLNSLVFPSQPSVSSKESLEYDRILSGTDILEVESSIVES